VSETSSSNPQPAGQVKADPGKASIGRAVIIGAGLMGGSVAMALRALGWFVLGSDRDPAAAQRGVDLGAFDAVIDATDSAALLHAAVDVVFVCAPVLSIAALASHALASGAIVTDIGSVKGPIVTSVNHPMFVGGHPMAGSEQHSIEGSTPTMFQGRTWVLTPTAETNPAAFLRLHTIVASMGALVVSVPPERHDELVAVVSHVPHLAASTLMGVAADGAEEHAALLRLAAGGFRDMTRIAAGHPSIWIDICAENRVAIVDVLGRFIRELSDMRDVVDRGDLSVLRDRLERARIARVNLPIGAPPAEELVEMRVPIPDRPGFIAEVTTLASELDVNIYDIEVSHTMEGGGGAGVLVLIIAAKYGDLFRGGLMARKFRASVSPLTPA
jgi:prephenate dehydrogenase